MGSWVAVFADTLEYVFGADYNLVDSWGISRLRFEVFTLGTLGVIIAFAILGYILGKPVREREVDIPLELGAAAAAGD
jgi:glutamate:GABA antiporter